MFKLLKQSAVIRESLIKVINKSGKTKKEIAKQVNVSQQSLSDWTTPHNTKPVTLENAQALTDHFRDSDFTLHVIHKFFGLFKSIENSWLVKKYGKLNPETWKEDLALGFKECFRVLKPNGTLVFKWNEDQIKLSEILNAIDYVPLYGNKRAKTHWLVFMKSI